MPSGHDVVKGFKHLEHARVGQCGEKHTADDKPRKRNIRQQNSDSFNKPATFITGSCGVVSIFQVIGILKEDAEVF